MNHPVQNDQLYIAERFLFIDQYTEQVAQLAQHKIYSYKLSMQNAAFCQSRSELQEMVMNSLFNYTTTLDVLWEEGFFLSPFEN